MSNVETNWRAAAAVLVLVLVGTGWSIPVAANTPLNDTLDDIEWGDSKSTVIKKIKQKKLEKIRQQRKYQNDRVAMQRARQSALEDVESIRESYTKLEGEKTGFEVSVIAGEYTKNNNESVIKDTDDEAQKFYFFHDGALYKKFVAYRQEYVHKIPFKKFVRSVAAKYGKPASLDHETNDDNRRLIAAVWRGPTTQLRVENKMDFFGNYTMAFADRKKVEQMREKGKALGGREKDRDDISERVQKIKQGSRNDPNENVVDDMVGESVEVDFGREKSIEEERPSSKDVASKDEKSEEPEASEEEKSSEQKEESSGSTETAAQSSSTDSQTGGSDEGSKDEGGEEDGEDLVIY